MSRLILLTGIIFLGQPSAASALTAATADSTSNTIHACVSRFDGFTRIVAYRNECILPFETYTEWQQTGASGPQGAAGATGLPGAMGLPGPVGLRGLAGSPGATGPAGPIGATGPAGSIGVAGPIGATGLGGTPGPTGPQGPIGSAGASGPQGTNFGQVFTTNRFVGAQFTGAGSFSMNVATNFTLISGLFGGESNDPTTQFLPVACSASNITFTIMGGQGTSTVDLKFLRTNAAAVNDTPDICTVTLNHGETASCTAPQTIVYPQAVRPRIRSTTPMGQISPTRRCWPVLYAGSFHGNPTEFTDEPKLQPAHT